MSLFAVLLVLVAATCAAFSPQHVTAAKTSTSSSSTTALSMANDNDLLRWARSARTAGVDDRVVELRRPLGVVLSEDASGNVYVETVAARGNAARTGEVSLLGSAVHVTRQNQYNIRVWSWRLKARADMSNVGRVHMLGESSERHIIHFMCRVAPTILLLILGLDDSHILYIRSTTN